MALITPAQRLAALHSAKTLLTGGENTVLFAKTSPPAPNPTPMIRVAEYILTGVDYRDSDPATAGDIHGHDGRDTPDEGETLSGPKGETGDSAAGPPLEKDEADTWTLADKDGTL